ncbi:unnamed protein product [Orchesella dallaii]|uniref:Transmembrane protein 198 n=1 Tax=Orchesella dallaii TaxID=48710 RepID=A0ABP1PQK4_9HEXA
MDLQTMYPSLLDIRQNYTDLTSSDYFPTGGGDDEEGGGSSYDFYSSSTSENPPWMYPTLGSTTASSSGGGAVGDGDFSSNNNATLLDCTTLDSSYDPGTALILVAVFVFGILFCIFGYRCYKAVLFITGFSFGLVIVALICQEEDLLPQYGNIGISTLSGFLYGLICLLVPYVGFFTVGLHAGLLGGIASMLFFPVGYSIWISVIFLLGAGLFGAIANVCFPSLTIVSTAMIGSAAVTVSFDYFVEKLKMAFWVWSHVKGKIEPDFCWFSWLLLGLWPTLVMLGVLIQCLVTGKGFTIHTYPYKKRQPTRRRLTREERALARQAKYRYLYQIRTAGGDILSQAYIQQLHKPQVDTMSTHMSTLPTQEDTTADE